MDPDMRAMLADLGNTRRDDITAQEDRRDVPLTRQQEAHIRNAADNRRQNAHLAGATDEDRSRLRQWNTPDTFGGDDVAEQLENRFSGQGHRRQLQQQVQNYDRDFEGGQPRQPRRGPSGHHRPHDRFAEASTRSPLMNRDPNRQRAPSPSAGGKMRFVHDKAIPLPGSGNAGRPAARAIPRVPLPGAARGPLPSEVPPIPRPDAHARRTRAARAPIAHVPRPQTLSAPARAIAPPPPPASVTSNGSVMSAFARVQRATAVSTPMPSSSTATSAEVKPATATEKPTPAAAPIKPTKMNDMKRKMLALANAADQANTDIGDEYMQYARRILAHDAVVAVRDADVERYLGCHKDRNWQVAAVLDARADPNLVSEHPGLQAIYDMTRAMPQEVPTPAPVTAPSPAESTTEAPLDSSMSEEETEEGFIAVSFLDPHGNLIGSQRFGVAFGIQAHVTMTATQGLIEPITLADALEAVAKELSG